MGTSSLVITLVAAFLPLMVIAASADTQQQQQIKLEDIERDNLNSAKQQRLQQQQQQQQQDAQQQQLLAYQQQQQLSAYQQQPQHPLQQQSISLTPSTLQQIAAAYQPQPQQHHQLYLPQFQQQQQQLLLQSYLAGASPQYTQYTGLPSGIYTGSQLAAALQGGAATHASPALTNNIQASSASALPISAYFNQQQITPHQQIIAIPAAAFQQAFLSQQQPVTNYLQSAANLQQYVQTPTVSIPAASAVQKPYQAPSVAATYTPTATHQAAVDGSAYTNQLKQQQLDAYNAQLKQQQQQLYQQAQNEYNALLQQQQQQQKNAYAAGVKSTAAPPAKPSQSSASSGGFVPIQTPSLAHPNRGVSFSHYRRGRSGI